MVHGDGPDGLMTELETSNHHKQDKEEREFRVATSRILVIGSLVIVCLLFLGLLAVQFGKGYWLAISLNHFPAVLGLPGAAVAAMVVVIVLRNVEGPIEFQGLGFKFKGASGPVVLWVFCFLAIAGAIRLLWPLTTGWR